jgi:hypothetical protein
LRHSLSLVLEQEPLYIYFFFLAILEFELRASHLVGKSSIT